MKRTTIFLDDKLLHRVKQYAGASGVSFASVVREALASYVVAPHGTRSLPSIAGRFSSGSSDGSTRVDELLWRDPHG